MPIASGKQIFGFWLLVCLIVVCSSRGAAQASNDLRDVRVKDIHLSNATLLEILGELAVHHRIPIGFQIAMHDKGQVRLMVQANQASVQQVMDLIVQQVPLYRWELRDGVINIQPKDFPNGSLERFLSTHISRYSVPKDATKFEIRNAIFDLDEIKQVLASEKMGISRLDSFTYRSIYSKEVDLSISDTDVRSVLNKIVRESEHKIWVIQLRGEKRDTIEISF